jgi:hypothetical protein
VLLAACFLLSQIPCASAAEKDYPAWANLGGKIGNHDRYLGLLDVFVPLTQKPDGLWFTDLRLKDASGPEAEYNIGTGYRRMINDTWILGVYGFYDNLRSAHENYFQQGTIGMEALTKEWDFRVNAYFPETKKEVLSSTSTGTIDISGSTITTSTTTSETLEQALPGFDAEVGYRLPGSQDIRVYAGGFYFDRSGAPTISGPRARTEWRLEDFLGFKGTRLTVSGEYSHDQVRNDQVYAGLAVRIPFGPGAVRSNETEKGSLKSRMIEPIVRDVDIVSGEGETTTVTHNLPAINPNTGLAYTSIYYAAASSLGAEDGSTKEDAATLEGARDAAGRDGIILALSSEGTYTEVGYFELMNGQTLIGINGTLQARAGSSTGPLASLVMTNADPENTDSTVINGAGNSSDYVLGLSNNNTISDITVENADYASIAATAAGTGYNDGDTELGFTGGDVFIKNVTVRDSGIGSGSFGSGLYIEGANDVVVEGSSFDSSFSDNIYIDGANNVTITDTVTSNGEDNGMGIYNVTGDIALTNDTAYWNYGYGVDAETFEGQLTITGSDISNNYYTNLYIDNESSEEGGGDIALSSSTFSSSTDEGGGLEIYSVKSLKLTDVTASTNIYENIYIDGVWGTNDEGHAVSLHSVVANGSQNDYGLYISNTNGGSILIDNAGSGEGSTFNNNYDDNIAIYNAPLSGDVTINDTEAKNSTDSDGVYIDGANDITIADSSTVTGNAGTDIVYSNCNSYNGTACEPL